MQVVAFLPRVYVFEPLFLFFPAFCLGFGLGLVTISGGTSGVPRNWERVGCLILWGAFPVGSLAVRLLFCWLDSSPYVGFFLFELDPIQSSGNVVANPSIS